MQAAQEKITLRDFQEFVNRPENSGRLFELINGEIIEVMPGRTRNSEIHDIIVFAVRLFCQTHHLPCHTSSADGAYNVGENVVAPDFAYKPTPMSDEYPDPVAPQWVVEAMSPTDKTCVPLRLTAHWMVAKYSQVSSFPRVNYLAFDGSAT